jgi:hypothetical protein
MSPVSYRFKRYLKPAGSTPWGLLVLPNCSISSRILVQQVWAKACRSAWCGISAARMGRLARRKLSQSRKIAAHECFLLCSAPFLELSLVFDRISDTVEPLREYRRHRPAGGGIATKRPGVVLSNSDLQCCSSYPNIKASIGTPENVEKRALHHLLTSACSALTCHPEERAARLEGWGHRRGFMVRDGAMRLLTMRGET